MIALIKVYEYSRSMPFTYDVTHYTGVTALRVKATFLTFFTRNQRVYKVILPYKAQYVSLTTIKYIFEQFYVCVFSVLN